MKKEVNNTRRKRKLNIQKVFNLVSAMFILACCIFYGTRFIKLYIANNKVEKITVLADNIKDNNKDNELFKQINEDYYFTGESENNYVKYSNILWRIIKINNEKSVTLVADSSLTSLNPGTRTTYEKTYINKWLNKSTEDKTGILETNLNNPEKYLTYTRTCKDIVTDTKSISCKDKIEDTLITIPSIYDYVNTGGNKGFMNNEEYFYLTNMNKENKEMYIDMTGKTNYSDDTDILGIKPVITLKNTITLKEGDGTKENPYTFEEEQGLLGSYVKLGNDTWRIYSIEDNTVKLSLDNYLKVNNKEVSVVEMKNTPIMVYISKKSINGKSELPGAKLTIKDKDGKVAKDVNGKELTWTSTTEEVKFHLAPGTYYLSEEIAPKGYELSETVIKFVVGEDGTVKSDNKNVDNNLIVYTNTPSPEEVKTGSFLIYIIVIGTLSAGAATYFALKHNRETI